MAGNIAGPQALDTTMNRRRSLAVLFGSALAAVHVRAHGQMPTYRVGATATGIPFSYLDPKTSTMQGAMIDAARFVGAEAGFGVSIQTLPFASLISALNENRIDIIGAAMLVTTPRRDAIEFSDPVFGYPEGLVVNVSDKTPYRSLADLKGKVVGVQTGTVYVDFVKRAGEFADVKLYPSVADILREISQGRLFAGVADGPILAYQLAQNVSLRARLVSSYEPRLTGSVGFGVRKSDGELLAKINDAVGKLKADGTLDTIVARWNLK